MPVPALPAELWMRILPQVRQPVPEPRSNAPRSLIRQQDLTCVIRTCKLFQSIGEKILYTHVVTDRPQYLLPHSPSQVASKRRLFAHTRRLFLEYPEELSEPSYPLLLAQGSWTPVGLLHAQKQYLTRASCRMQIDALVHCLKTINAAGPTRKLFPKLHALAIGSIWGGQDDIWRDYFQSIGGNPSIYESGNPRVCASLLHGFCHTSNLRHLCFRGQHGPLVWPWSTFASVEQPPRSSADQYTWTAHVTAESDKYSIPYGRPGRWVSDSPSDTDVRVIEKVMGTVIPYANSTRSCKEIVEGFGHKPADAIDIDMYFSVSMGDSLGLPSAGRPSPPAASRRELAGLGDSVQGHFRNGSGIKDKFRWHPSSSAGRCEACGSTPPP